MFRASTLALIFLSASFLPQFVPLSAAESAGPPAALAPEAPERPERVVAARVGSTEVSVEDLIQFAALNPQRVRTLASGPQGKAEVLRLLIANLLLQQAMAAEGLLTENGQTDPETFQKAYGALRNKYFAVADEVPELDLREYYKNNVQQFGLPAAARISQIQFRFPTDADDDAKAATRRRAEAALQRLQAGEAFSAVAAEITDNVNAREAKGDLGFIPNETWSDWLSNALDGVAVGEHTGILPSPIGFEILKITEMREAVTAPYEDVRADVRRQVIAARESALRDAYVKRLAEKTDIVIELDDAQEFFSNGIFP